MARRRKVLLSRVSDSQHQHTEENTPCSAMLGHLFKRDQTSTTSLLL